MRTFIWSALAACLLISCTKNFESINTDPNRPKEITPGVMLGQLQYRMVNTSIAGARGVTHDLMQVTAPRSSPGGGGLHRYQINPGAGVWNNFYEQLTDVEDIYSVATRLNENNYRAIALIYKSWAYSILTDLYGDVPFFQASKAAEGIFQPAFDRQKDVYIQILQNLDSANKWLDVTKALTYGGDLLYAANNVSNGVNPGILKWKKFCNSMKLRLLLRISKKEGEINIAEQINNILSNPAEFPVFTSNADEAIFKYPGTFPYFNPYFNARTLDWREGTYFTKFFIDKMNTDADPRRAVWATTIRRNGADVYVGIESGYPVSVEYPVGQNSSYSDGLKTLPQLGIIMTYSELEFIKAELALRGFSTGRSVKDHYENGIRASMIQWGVGLPDGYLQKEGVAFNETADQESQLSQIMTQKYYAFFFNDYQSWFEKRRTGLPVLPRGAGIPTENKFPSRVPYPTYLQSQNPETLAAAVQAMGGDDSNIKVWWEK